jgi:polysaccharide pyruvyl transferase WcaK-like protein
VDAGKLSPFNERLVRQEASQTDLIITRSVAAADRLKAARVTAPIEVTSDNALNFQPAPADEGLPAKLWAGVSNGSGVVGLAVEDLYQWPVVMRPWGRREDCYKWPYYFSRSTRRRRQAKALVAGYAALADRLIAEKGKAVALICMEELDEPIARQVLSRMKHQGRARIISAGEYNASQVTILLRGLDLLITSRYHAAILSLAAAVPQVALGHDQRLKNLYQELALYDRYFLDPATPHLWQTLKERAYSLLDDPSPVRQVLRREYQEHLGKARRNRDLLASYARVHGWERALC